MAATLDELLSKLDELEDQAPLEWLVQELMEADITLADVDEYIRFSDQAYTRNLLRAGDWYHALVLCWKKGQYSPIHDHKDSNCAVRVLNGTLTETQFRFSPRGRLKAVNLRHYLPGSVFGSSDADLHQVCNLNPETELITLHIYSPPLFNMSTYPITDMSRTRDQPRPSLLTRIVRKASLTLRGSS